MAKKWIQASIKRPGRVRRWAAREGGLTKDGEIKQSWLNKKIAQVKRELQKAKPKSQRKQELRSRLSALNLAKRLETMGRGKRGK